MEPHNVRTVGSQDPKSLAPGSQLRGAGIPQSLLQNPAVALSVHKVVSPKMFGGGTSHAMFMRSALLSLYDVTAGKDSLFSTNTRSFRHSFSSLTTYSPLGLAPFPTHLRYSEDPRRAFVFGVLMRAALPTVIRERSSMLSARAFFRLANECPFVASTSANVIARVSSTPSGAA